jgi:hypothetical protein
LANKATDAAEANEANRAD